MKDSDGFVWSGRAGMLGPNRAWSDLVGKGVAGTSEDLLYGTTFASIEGYRLGVPHTGTYRVRLLMAEDWWRTAGRRVFDVTAEGDTVLENVDIASEVGYGHALDKEFFVTVTDGRLDLTFIRKEDLPQISAIEVTYMSAPTAEAPAHTPEPEEPVSEPTQPPAVAETPAPESTEAEDSQVAPESEVWSVRYTARSVSMTDTQGRTWGARPVGWGSWREVQISPDVDIADTEDDDLLRTLAPNTRWFDQRVPEAGEYRVDLNLVEGNFGVAGARVFDVVAEGRTVLSAVDIASAVGRNRLWKPGFDVEVNDGELNIDFISRTNETMIAGIEVSALREVGGGLTTEHPRALALAPTSVWLDDVTKAPLATNSAEVVANLSRSVSERYGGVAALNAFHYNTAHNVAPPGTPRVTVGFHNCQDKSTVGWGVFDGPAHFVDVPVPAGAVAAVGTDEQMSIYDPQADQLWEFWRMRPTTTGWEACWGGRIDDVSQSNGFFPDWFGASASGAATSAGMVTIDDVRFGEINHAMSLAVVESAAEPNWSWPAKRTDGRSKDSDVVRQGQRLRLDPSLDLDAYRLTPIGRLVAEAAQKYGFIVTDSAGAVSVITEAGAVEEARTGKDPWLRLLGGETWEAMAGFPWDELEALPVDYGKPADG